MHLDPSCFRVSTTTGFVLESPLEDLPAYFEPWQKIAKSMVHLMKDNRCRDYLYQIPLMDVDSLSDHHQMRLAHLQMTTLISGFIWCQGDESVPKVLPKNLAVPFYKLCQKLGVAPGIGAHVSTALSNYKIKNKNLPLSCDNMDMVYFKFIENFGNDWFFMATLQVELEFAPAVVPLKNALEDAITKNADSLQMNLQKIRVVIENMERSLGRMGDHLDPDVFFTQFRPFLAGTTGGHYEKWGGIILEGVSDKPFKLIGGSAAQAAPIQCLDALLQIEHQCKSKEFLLEMRRYMLIDHRRFIEEIENASRVRRVVAEFALEKPQLKKIFDDCVDALVNFRNRHIQVVSKYILVPKSKHGSDGSRNYKTLDDVGTGGTGIMPFLKNVRDTTKLCVLE